MAELLFSRNLPGTFYVPLRGYNGGPVLTAPQLQSLAAANFEIGAHTVTHRNLPGLASRDLRNEVRICKEVLEQTVSRKVMMFCYPNGKYKARVILELAHAGYVGARTTQMLSTKLHFRPFEMPTAVQAYPHPARSYLRNLGRYGNIPGLTRYMTKWRRCQNWVELGKQVFKQVLQSGGIWHLYGHSWEIEQMRIWPNLCQMLDYVSGRKEVTYVTNGQLMRLLKNNPQVQSGGNA